MQLARPNCQCTADLRWIAATQISGADGEIVLEALPAVTPTEPRRSGPLTREAVTGFDGGHSVQDPSTIDSPGASRRAVAS